MFHSRGGQSGFFLAGIGRKETQNAQRPEDVEDHENGLARKDGKQDWRPPAPPLCPRMINLTLFKDEEEQVTGELDLNHLGLFQL
jgi:hypothetical protein